MLSQSKCYNNGTQTGTESPEHLPVWKIKVLCLGGDIRSVDIMKCHHPSETFNKSGSVATWPSRTRLALGCARDSVPSQSWGLCVLRSAAPLLLTLVELGTLPQIVQTNMSVNSAKCLHECKTTHPEWQSLYWLRRLVWLPNAGLAKRVFRESFCLRWLYVRQGSTKAKISTKHTYNDRMTMPLWRHIHPHHLRKLLERTS